MFSSLLVRVRVVSQGRLELVALILQRVVDRRILFGDDRPTMRVRLLGRSHACVNAQPFTSARVYKAEWSVEKETPSTADASCRRRHQRDRCCVGARGLRQKERGGEAAGARRRGMAAGTRTRAFAREVADRGLACVFPPGRDLGLVRSVGTCGKSTAKKKSSVRVAPTLNSLLLSLFN